MAWRKSALVLESTCSSKRVYGCTYSAMHICTYALRTRQGDLIFMLKLLLKCMR